MAQTRVTNSQMARTKSQATATPSPPTTTATPSADDQIVRNAAAFGWALTELLSRCFLLQPHSDDELKALDQVWLGTGLQILPPIRTDRQQIWAVFYYTQSLAKQLPHLADPIGQVDPGALDSLPGFLNPGVPVDDALKAKYKDKSYVDLINDHIITLCANKFNPTKSIEIRGQINGLLQYWDTMIYEQLQEASTDPDEASAYLNAYLVGRSFSSLRWNYDVHGLPLYWPPQSVQAQILTMDSLPRLCQHVELMASSLPEFAAVALSNSVQQWGNALLQPQVSKDASIDAQRQAKLQEQAVIWHDLLTGSRDPKTYVDPSSIGWRYTWKMFQFLLPYIGLGVLLSAIIAVVFLFLLGFLWPLIVGAVTHNPFLVSIVTTIGTGFALLTGIGAAIPSLGALWNWLTGKVQANVDQGAGAALNDAQASLITMLWNAAQQEEINKATYIPVP